MIDYEKVDKLVENCKKIVSRYAGLCFVGSCL